jgi:hypothetical protein
VANAPPEPASQESDRTRIGLKNLRLPKLKLPKLRTGCPGTRWASSPYRKGKGTDSEPGGMELATAKRGEVPSLPPDDLGAAIRRALNDPAVRREIVSLLCGDEDRRERRLAQLAQELDGMEYTMRLGTDDENG